jgi:hypothetical protein
MKRQEVRIIGPSAHLPDARRASQRSVNLYMSRGEGVGEDRSLVLASCPGAKVFLAMSALIRGSYQSAGRWFVVSGDKLYEVWATGVSTERGTLLTSSGYVSMRAGQGQLVLVDGNNGYVLNLTTNAFARITDVDWLGSRWVSELDGFYIFVRPDSDQFYVSAIDDGANIDALDFSTADAKPDKIVTQRVHKRELYLFGETSTEIWINSGGLDFPFTRYNSTPIDIGCVGLRAAINTLDSLMFVGRSDSGQGYVYELQGHQPVRISTEAVESALAQCEDISRVTMWTYHTVGAEFVGINAPGMPITWVYDTSTRQWHERGQLVDGEWSAFPAEQVTHLDGVHYAINESTIYTLEGTNIAGEPLTRERTMPHLVLPSLDPINYKALELACLTGSGGNITLEISNDGGRTYGPPLQRSLGATGRYMQRTRWLGLGTAFDRVFRLRVTDDTDFTLYSGSLEWQ